MNYFSGCQDIKQARKVYIKLAQQHHPDKGGDNRVMQEINNQFDLFRKHGKVYETRKGQRHTFSTDEYADAFDYSFNWGAFDFESMRRDFYRARGKKAGPKEAKFAKEHKGTWSDEYEKDANEKAKQDAEELKARKQKLKEDIERAKYESWYRAKQRAYEENKEKEERLEKAFRRIAQELNEHANRVINPIKGILDVDESVTYYEFFTPEFIKKVVLKV